MIPVTLVTEDRISSHVANVLLRDATAPFSVELELPGTGRRRFAAGSGQIEKRIADRSPSLRRAIDALEGFRFP